MAISEEFRTRVDLLADEVALLVVNAWPLLEKTASTRGAKPRDRADVEITMARVGRMHQLLQGARLMARSGFGTAIAPIVRAMWETWFDTAWMLSAPKERSQDLWTAGIAQQLGMIDAYRKRDGYLIPALQQAETQLVDLVKREPHLFRRWLDEQGNLIRSVHSIKWTTEKTGKRSEVLGPMYKGSYDIDYTILSIASHGEGMELGGLLGEGPNGETLISAGAGVTEAVDHMILGCGVALGLAYEVQHAYLGGHTHTVDELKQDIELLRDEFKALRDS